MKLEIDKLIDRLQRTREKIVFQNEYDPITITEEINTIDKKKKIKKKRKLLCKPLAAQISNYGELMLLLEHNGVRTWRIYK
jgi:hypothetical protein